MFLHLRGWKIENGPFRFFLSQRDSLATDRLSPHHPGKASYLTIREHLKIHQPGRESGLQVLSSVLSLSWERGMILLKAISH